MTDVLIRWSLRAKILLLTGSVIVLLMLVISFVLLFQWRSMIIQTQADNVSAISRTFAVTVVDAMIYEETAMAAKENVLESYVENFVDRLDNVRYVVIIDDHGVPIVQCSASRQHDPFQPLVDDLSTSRIRRVHISNHPLFGWCMEVRHPLIFSGRQWGTAVIGFEAESIRNEISNIFFMLLFATVTITLTVLLILYVFISRITSSVENLVRAIDTIDFQSDSRIDLPDQQDEIGFFYRHFRLLQERLEASKNELAKAQRQIYHAEKLASIGRLASGVAHQVNNPLNGIKSCLYALKQHRADAQRADEYLLLINDGIDDIENIVKKLLGFARQQSTSDSVIDINDSIRKVIGLFDLRLKEKDVSVRLDLNERIAKVRIDAHLFQEVVMNMVLNSYDAIERNGAISISTGHSVASTVFLEIRDNGAGILPDDLKKIFDPFFTTKDVGMGTGLGLSVCMGIIESHGGRIDVHSTPNVETVFTIHLPVAHEH